MTINDLIRLLSKEVEKGNGDKKVGYIGCFEPCLCELKEDDCGFYTEEWFVKENEQEIKQGESTRYIIGNYKTITNPEFWD